MASVEQKPEIVKILTSDNKTIAVPKFLTVRSKLLTTMIKILEKHPERFENDVLRVPDVSSANFRRIISWCHFHQHDPKYYPAQPRRNDATMSVWDVEYLSVHRHQLLELLDAAGSLGIFQLQELVANHITDMARAACAKGKEAVKEKESAKGEEKTTPPTA